MGKRLLMKGNEAISEAAIMAGCRAYFCYPITPQNEVAEYMSRRMPEAGGVYLQGESELAVSYMLFGAAGAGVKCFTTSSSPGISLMAEGMSYIAAAELPVVIINVQRNGPGLGGILPAQGDYHQATKGAGHGDYKCIVLGPATVQEAVDEVMLAFELAQKYRTPVLVLMDGMMGQMMEPVELPTGQEKSREIDGHEEWATFGAKGRKPHLVKTLNLNPAESWRLVNRLKDKYAAIEKAEVRYEEVDTQGELDVLLVAYGTMARICKTSMEQLKAQGVKVGMFRPISLWPFPLQAIRDLAPRCKRVVTVELSMGQMVEDVDRAVQGRAPVEFYGKAGGFIPTPEEVTEAILAMVRR